jgi:hypothetical protein
MVPLGDVGQVEAPFNLLVDCINLNATLVHGLHERTIGSEINLGTTDGTS